MEEIKSILVVGAGTMGSAIAQTCAGAGYLVTMADVNQELLDGAFEKIEKNITGMREEGFADDVYVESVKKNLSVILSGEIPRRGREYDLVVEVVPENKEIKKATYQMLSDSCRNDAVLASNTSGMDVFSLTAPFLKNPARLLITHWFNPPHLMKLIEVVKGPETSEEAVLAVRAVLEKCGKKPAVLNKYMPGFIVNRMATCICRELYYMIQQGWVTPEDAENALKYTDGLRWSFEGPLELWDYVGLETTFAVADGVLPSLCNEDKEFPLKQEMIESGKMGVRAGEGMLRRYDNSQKAMDAYIAKRNRRILTMYKVMNQFEAEDKKH